MLCMFPYTCHSCSPASDFLSKNMPKKFQGENSKAAVARARKAEAAAREKMKKDQAEEDALWSDNDKQIKKKLARKEDRDKKRQAELQRKAENRALAEVEVAEITPKSAVPQKVTAYQLQKIKEKQAETEKEIIQTHLDVPLVENLNRTIDEVVSASGVDAALSALSVQDDSTDRHPERRMAAAFKAFETQRLPQIKKENPNLRLSQLKQLLRKEWQKSPENPLNKIQHED
ncbi:coiled-coil domain-containing protein 124 isoform X1 [Cherax quadricarinatus]|uniref:coiled-coil domain-containing protein 124 isoform X1 n=1 Tax=Cherax quadricarinatus TaxID=27406 RepID=UPI00387E7391